MRYLRTNTAVNVTIGPFLDYADGLTPKDTLTVTGITGVLAYDDDDGTVGGHADFTCSASGGDNDLVAVGHNGLWTLELTAAQVNHLGRAILSLMAPTQICPVFHEFQILAANVYDSLFAGVGPTADLLDVNVEQHHATAQTAGRDLGTVLPASALNNAPAIAVDGTLKVDVAKWLTAAAPAMTGDAFARLGATPPTAAQIATAIWQDLVAGTDFTTAASVGVLLNALAKAAGATGTVSATKAAGAEGGLPVLPASLKVPATVAAGDGADAALIKTVTDKLHTMIEAIP